MRQTFHKLDMFDLPYMLCAQLFENITKIWIVSNGYSDEIQYI